MGVDREAGFDDIGRAILEGNRYMTLATADSTGRPWATPLYFTPHEFRDLDLLS